MLKYITGVMLATALILTPGCRPADQQMVARQLGQGSALLWRYADSPSQADIDAAVIAVAYTRSALMSVNTTDFYATVYPGVEKLIVDSLPPERQAIALMAAGWALTGIKTAFALHPDWGQNAQPVAEIAVAYCDGFLAGLDLPDDSPEVQATMSSTSSRARASVLRKRD